MSYSMRPAPEDSWREFDVDDPDPGYYQFDWLSARHPDLYHRFALTSVALAEEVLNVIDFSSCTVIDVGTGTGRFSAGIAPRCRSVLCVDAYEGPVSFAARSSRSSNCSFIRGDRSHLPVMDNTFDIVTCCWAELDIREANRVVKPGGWVVHMGASDAPGELTPILAAEFPNLVQQPSTDKVLADERSQEDFTFDITGHSDITFVDDRIHVRDFTCVADYEEPDEAAAIFGRLFGPRAAAYLRDRHQSTVWSRQRIYYGQVAK